MEIGDNDIIHITELLHTIVKLCQYYDTHEDQDYKFYQQPILFNKPKNKIEWKNTGIENINKFQINIVNNDVDIILYTNELLNNNKPIVIHDILDWTLIIISIEDFIYDDKIYVNVNKDSNLYGFYVYSNGGNDSSKYKYDIIATNDTQFKLFWDIMTYLSKNKTNNINLISKSLEILCNRYKCLLSDYYNCSDEICLIKKKQICNMLNIQENINIYLSIIDIGVCYWVCIYKNNEVILGGDLFYDKISDSFITRGKSDNFLSWNTSFDKINKFLEKNNNILNKRIENNI